jgi:hypothetical protein
VRRALITLLGSLVVIGLAVGATGCNDLGDFRGTWSGGRVGDSPVLKVGVGDGATATLTIDFIDRHGLSGRLAVDGVIDDTALVSLAGAEADVLAGISFGGTPVRVYLAFVEAHDHLGQALAVVALYDAHRVEVRILRGGAAPLYGIFALRAGP